MHPSNGLFVKIYFNNGFSESGIVHSWNESQIVLDNKDSLIVINNPNDIFVYKIYKDRKEETPINNDIYVDKEMIPTIYTRDPVDRAKNLLQLRKDAKEEELKRARDKLTEFRATGQRIASYDTAELLRAESILRNSSKED